MRRFAINKICLNELNFEQAVEATARAGFHGFTPWYDDVVHLAPADARKVISDAGLDVAGFCNCGLFALDGPDNKTESIDRARRSIDYAAEIGSPSIVTVVGGLIEGSKDLQGARSFAFDCLAEVLEYARTTPVTLALEALHPMYTPDWSMVGSLKDANDWCDRLGEGIGLTIDTYHTWWDPTVKAELERAAANGRLTTYHVSDWLVPTNHMLLDRGMPGDGVIDLAGYDNIVTGVGYDGAVEVEIFSERLWATNPHEFLATLRTRMTEMYR